MKSTLSNLINPTGGFNERDFGDEPAAHDGQGNFPKNLDPGLSAEINPATATAKASWGRQ